MNVARSLSRLGIACTAIGQAGEDLEGDAYIDELKRMGIEPLFARGTLPTGRSLCLVTPDGQRTMKTYIGAAHEKNKISLQEQHFTGAEMLHFEGYQILDPEIIIRVLELAKQAGIKISMDLGSPQLVEQKKDFIFFLIEQYIDLVFANCEEAKALTGKTPYEAAEILSSFCEVAIVTLGAEGGIVQTKDRQIYYPAKYVEKVLDTTGAGDFFASGFLWGYLCSLDIEECAFIGAEVTSRVIQHSGVTLPIGEWNDLKRKINSSIALQ